MMNLSSALMTVRDIVSSLATGKKQNCRHTAYVDLFDGHLLYISTFSISDSFHETAIFLVVNGKVTTWEEMYREDYCNADDATKRHEIIVGQLSNLARWLRQRREQGAILPTPLLTAVETEIKILLPLTRSRHECNEQ
jgi:hypothetical protein